MRATLALLAGKVGRMVLAQIGPLTTVMESLTTAVGAGILLGSFLMGAFGYLLGWERRVLEVRALTDGLAGGIASVLVVLLDLLVSPWL